MTWFKVDDSFYDHPKVFDAPDCAVALWTRAGTWSARNLTDGFVPAGMPARFCNDADQAVRELLNRGLWKRARGGYQFHDWSAYQPTADDVRTMREKRANAGRIGGLASGKARSKTEAKHEASASAGASDLLEPPTRPDPTTKNNIKTSSSPPPAATDSPEFVRFWQAYPRPVGKGQARRAWATAVKRGTDPETIIEAAGRYAARVGNQDPKYIPHPATWLNGERWDDAPDPEPVRDAAPVMPWDLWG